MSVEGNMSENHDRQGSKNYNLSVTHGEPGNFVKGTAIVNGLTDGGAYQSVGGNLAMEKSGFGAQLGGVHTGRGDQLSAAANVHVIHTDNHKMDVNAFATKSMPNNHPSFVTHGGGVDYMYKNTVGTSASVAHTPMFKQTDYNIGAKMNLHQTPTSTMSLGLGASRTTAPRHNSNWQPNAFFNTLRF